jgi:ubiquinone/menaquinone biosynthesis C-methylase UbiE
VLLEFLHRLASHPWVYDRIQTLAGNDRVIGRLSQEIVSLKPKVVVDIGGGTGAMQNLFVADCLYICLDMEMPKLGGFLSRNRKGLAVLGDATSMPIGNDCADMIICKAVTHHLTDVMLDKALEESRRVLRAGGHLILFDAVFNRKSLVGQLLWKLDRGSHPRTEDALRKNLQDKFEVVHWEKFAVYHEYVFGIGVRP